MDIINQKYKFNISCGARHAILLDNNGSVYSMGDNKYGQLGTQDFIPRKKPTKINLNNIQIISCGPNHSIFIDNKNQVFGCGLGPNFGLINISVPKPTKIELPEEIIMVAAVQDGTMFLSKTGQVYVIGLNSESRFGILNYNLTKPTKIDIPEKIKYISCSRCHSCLVTQDGFLYSSGYNSQGQTCFPSGTIIINKYTKIPYLQKIISVSCSDNSTVVLDSHGKIYYFGDLYQTNQEPILIFDHGPQKPIFYESRYQEKYKNYPVYLPKYGKIINISVSHQVLLLTDQHEIYSYGLDLNNLPGNKWENSQLPKKINLQKIIRISTGDYFSICITEDGNIYSFGSNLYGQLGLDSDQENFLIPQIIPNFNLLNQQIGGDNYRNKYFKYKSKYLELKS